MGRSRPLFVYFRPFLITISIIQIEKSIDGVALDSNLRPHDGRRRDSLVGDNLQHMRK